MTKKTREKLEQTLLAFAQAIRENKDLEWKTSNLVDVFVELLDSKESARMVYGG